MNFLALGVFLPSSVVSDCSFPRRQRYCVSFYSDGRTRTGCGFGGERESPGSTEFELILFAIVPLSAPVPPGPWPFACVAVILKARLHSVTASGFPTAGFARGSVKHD